MDRIVRISGVTYQPVGSTAYASVDQVRQWYGKPLEFPPKAITGIAIAVEPAYVRAVERELYEMDGVASVEVIKYIREEIDELMKSSRTFFNIMLAFSVILAAVIIFNSTLMNGIERTREIATMRTIGLSASRVSWMLSMENLVAYACGMVLGLPLGSWLADSFVQMYESESFSMRTVIFARTYWLSVLGILATVLISQLPGIRYVRRIEIAKATKDIG